MVAETSRKLQKTGMCSLWWESIPVPAGGFQWWPHPLDASLQWRLISKAIHAAFRSIPSCGVPHSCPLMLSLNSQQWHSSWICFPNLMLLHSTLISTGSFLGCRGLILEGVLVTVHVDLPGPSQCRALA